MAKRNHDPDHEGRDRYFVDIDRMINEGLGGGQVTLDNGLIEEARELSEEVNRTSPTKQEER
ncbi:hypothetical protein CathTA2_2859 [Caldalkalibacillus thermarum TA2.A1]|uniref:Uncharacterized protein n=1 Tax=Caldalkalibacillus thermarum (strain TA2.A1) TaxID=986075 RepID=F5LAC4_CALTT|nr:hypothetical protein [Caldalkalibacillus thermarum]EGL81673.1 hypothetical protein CathTA2_2859 [Caldalkalibacillus thermarum TA2.A1]QZT33268.1 hypothetical protein HUR95_13360 [Caldalkalibacillus thermarum TA2.A1]GGK27533.1 hypothetical protein GCM10010965_20460 [Caldalkalibacillus thermarum]